jgi:hypothetical protein
MALESSVANVYVQSDVPVFSASVSHGLILRGADDNNYLLMLTNALAAITNIYKRVAGTYTLLTTVSTAWASGDVMKFDGDASNLITAYRNGSSVTSITEAAGAGNTQHGYWVDATANDQRYDNFLITALAAAGVATTNAIQPAGLGSGGLTRAIRGAGLGAMG